MKFVLPGADPAAIVTLLGFNAEPHSFNGRAHSAVHSIYFDNLGLESCRDSMDGLSPRTKVRLRWYDAPFTESDAYFELKLRDNLHAAKRRHPVRFAEPVDRIDFSRLIRALKDQAGTDAVLYLAKYDTPTVLVSYDRVHLRDRESPIRMTVDYNIRGYDQLGFDRPGRRFESPLDGLVVVEVKIPDGAEAAVAPLLFPLKPRLSRLSKYASCASRMSWNQLPESQD